MSNLFIIGGAALFVTIFVAAIYNNLIRKKNQVDNAFGSVDVQLKKRYDLIPNLVETVKQYMTHEKDLLVQVTNARAQAISGNVSQDEKVNLENSITKSLGKILVSVENYPQLKADKSFTLLQKSWNEAEEQISAARRFYNTAITDYNNAVETFPNNIIAGMMNYKTKEVFVIPETERENISAKNLFDN